MRANGKASGPVFTSGFMVDLAHCAMLTNDIRLYLNRVDFLGVIALDFVADFERAAFEGD